MELVIQNIINSTKEKYGLDCYNLYRHHFSRKVNLFNATTYVLNMEWFPDHADKLQEEEGLNPEGTAVIEYNLTEQIYEKVIFVGGISYAAAELAQKRVDRDTVIRWIQQETGLEYGKQFQFQKEDGKVYDFTACFDGIQLSPSGLIRVSFDQDGRLTYYSIDGPFPSRNRVDSEYFSLSIDDVESWAKEQVRFLEIPSFEEQRMTAVYGVEERYIVHSNPTLTLPFVSFHHSSVDVNEVLKWDSPMEHPVELERRQLDMNDEVTMEDVIAGIPHPDSFPITKEEQLQCMDGTALLVRQLYPEASGKWTLTTLHREQNYIVATCRQRGETKNIFSRKLMIFFDRISREPVNYIDNQTFQDAFFQDFKSADAIKVSKDEAYEQLRSSMELTPAYVYIPEQKKYILCGKLDCKYAIRASDGERIVLSDV